MLAIDSGGASNRDPDRVYGNRIPMGEVDQKLTGMWLREEIFRMDLEPPDRGTSGHHLGNVRKPETDACTVGFSTRTYRGGGHLESLLFRSFAAADDPLAIAFRNVNPGFRIGVEFRRSTARVVSCGRAVVLAGLG